MKPIHVWLASLVALGLGAFQGCSSDSNTDDQSSAGTAGSSSNGGKNSQGGASVMTGGSNDAAGQASAVSCSVDDCGPQLGLPNWTCEDGSIGGPTGRCLLRDAVCGWEVRECPVGEPGAGGAGNEGGSANSAGAPAGGASSDKCGGCDTSGATPKICIYQAGGPGPAHYTCATQNPCGAVGACACIVNQGTCSNTLMDGYCVCDNGLE